MNHIYYLHTNNELIGKPYYGGIDADMRESDFVRMYWRIDTTQRLNAWRMLVEALSIGASKERIFGLAQKWSCDDSDADTYAGFIGVTIDRDGNQWCAKQPNFINQMESACGFGDSKLEALSELCKEIGYKGQKMWGQNFHELLAA